MTEHVHDVSAEASAEELVSATNQPACAGQGSTTAPSHKRPRGRNGCLNCRKRRKKCDERKPTCAKCRHFGERCEWDAGVTFRCSGIDSAHPSMRARKPSTQKLQMVDVTFDSSTHRRIESRKQPHDSDLESPLQEEPVLETLEIITDLNNSALHFDAPQMAVQHAASVSPEFVQCETISQIPPSETRDAAVPDLPSSASTTSEHGGLSEEVVRNAFASPLHSLSPLESRSEIGLPGTGRGTAVELEALDYLTSHSAAGLSLHQHGESSYWHAYDSAPDALPSFDPGVAEQSDKFSQYYPNREYRELHATLYNHMVDTARATGLTRQGTPELAAPPDTSTHCVGVRITDAPVSSPSPSIMPKHREMELWCNYLGEIATWLDMFDNDKHFQNTLPVLAQSSHHLRLSILALSARQLERKDAKKPYIESLRLYQEAIQMIVQELQSMDTTVIASCVLLCVLEMMSSSPKDWAHHLDGCALLIKAAGINGVVGGVRQAIFWCFARMDMWGGFLTDTSLKIPTSLWFLPSGSMSAAVNRFRTDFKSFDQYANYAVFLCASALNVVSSDDKASYNMRWRTLFDLLEDWYCNRPPEMRSILSGTDDVSEYPFPVVLYSNPPAISGNQLYHAAALLMLQAKPREIKIRSHKSIFWHARQICGITASNPSHSAYTNAPQPLWIAGKVLSHPSEHKALLELLWTIERETGFASMWRAEDLKVHWGEFDET